MRGPLGVVAWRSSFRQGLGTRRANAVGKLPCTLSGYVHVPRIACELLKGGDKTPRLGQNVAFVVRFDPLYYVVYPEAVIAHRARQIGKVRLLLRDVFEKSCQLRAAWVQRVVESDLVRF